MAAVDNTRDLEAFSSYLQRVIDDERFDCGLHRYCPSLRPSLDPHPYALIHGVIPLLWFEDLSRFDFNEDIDRQLNFEEKPIFSNKIIWGTYGLERTCHNIIGGLIKQNLTLAEYASRGAHLIIEPKLNIEGIIAARHVPLEGHEDLDEDLLAQDRGNEKVTLRLFIRDFSLPPSRYEYAEKLGINRGTNFQDATLYHALTSAIAWHLISNHSPYLTESKFPPKGASFSIKTSDGYTVEYVTPNPEQKSLPTIHPASLSCIRILPKEKVSKLPSHSLFVYSSA